MPTGTPTKIKQCKICKKEFLPKTPSQILCGEDHYQPCPVCGKLILWNHTYEIPVCSKECKNIRRKQRCIQKYGVEHPMQSKEVQRHHKDSMLEKYGVESPLQSEEIRQRAMESNRERYGADWVLGDSTKRQEFKQIMFERYGGETTLQSEVLKKKVESTNLEKYGHKNAMQNEDVQQKVKNTLIQRYGVDNPMKCPQLNEKAMQTRIKRYGSIWSESIKRKTRETWIKNYGVDNPFKSEEIKEKIKRTRTKLYGESWYSKDNLNKVSQINIDFAEYCTSIGIQTSYERYIMGKFYDINIDDRNIVVEINPSYTHSYKPTHLNTSRPPEYHIEKTKLANRYGIRCIHIWDWDDSNKIANMLVPVVKRIYARNCKLFVLYQNYAEEFLDAYCIYPADHQPRLHLGLVYNNELIQLMSFSEYNESNYEYELEFLCTKPGYQIIGGASKLFHFATHEYEMNNIIAYCDISKFTGDVYEAIGMQKINYIDPIKYWSLDKMCIPDEIITPKMLKELFDLDYLTTNVESTMMDSPWIPVYDCGQAVYEYRR